MDNLPQTPTPDKITAIRAVMHPDTPADYYLTTAAGDHLVSCSEWYDAMNAIRQDPARRMQRAGEYAWTVKAIATPRPATVVAAVEEIAARGKEKTPALAGRLDSAVALVLGGKVILKGDGAKVSPYTVSDIACTCTDFQYRGGWCKHRLAVRMARHLAANGFEVPTEATAPRPIVARPQKNIRQKDLELIATGKVLDAAQRDRTAYAQSGHGAKTAALRMLGNGAKSIPADLARRAGMAGNGNKEN